MSQPFAMCDDDPLQNSTRKVLNEKLFGRLKFIVAGILSLAAVFVWLSFNEPNGFSVGKLVSVIIVFAFAFWLNSSGTKNYVEAKRIEASVKPSPLSQSSQRPVVYLRSFKDDVVTADVYGEYLTTEEEALATLMNEIGTFVALERPGERLPEPGAYREYAQGKEWQQEVINMLSIAQLVVVRLGITKGKEIAVLRGHEDDVSSAAFNPDGSRIAHLQTMSVKDLLTQACAHLTGLTKLTRDEMRLAGYPDSMPKIHVCIDAERVP